MFTVELVESHEVLATITVPDEGEVYDEIIEVLADWWGYDEAEGSYLRLTYQEESA